MGKKSLEFIGITVIILIMTAAVFVFLAPQFGWRVDSVYSGSMEPAMKVGGVVVTRPVPVGGIEAGDIITFYSPQNNALTSHRVAEVVNSPVAGFRTRGDANEDIDPFIVPGGKVVGEVCFHLPYLGYIAGFMKTRLGLLLTICLPGFVIIIRELISIWRVLKLHEI